MIKFVDLSHAIAQHWSVFVGFLVVAAYARQRFNEPTFPGRETLPQTVAPLRYLFLPSAYERARRIYIVASLLLYGLLLLPGQQIIEIFGIGSHFPPQAWPLLVALILVGLLPATSAKWITMLEEHLRRNVHEFYLVPDGVAKTIAVLEDAPYEPPASQLDAIPDGLREKLLADLKLGRGLLRHRWARATTLMASLNQMGAGAVHPLRRAAFKPFAEDFDAILSRHKALAQDIATLTRSATPEKEEALKRSVNMLLRRIYAYISWGIRQQAGSDREIIQTLDALGFSIPVVEGRRLFNIVAPVIGVVAVVTMMFWLTYDAIDGELWKEHSKSVIRAWTSAMAAAAMYGLAALIALKQRGVQIEQRVWDESPRCLVRIAIKAGLITWLAIVVSTLIGGMGNALISFAAIVQMDWTAVLPDKPGVLAWSYLPIKIATASVWFLAGAAVSAVLAVRMGGDVRRTCMSDRVRDAAWLGVALGLAVAFAQMMQSALAQELGDPERAPLTSVPIIASIGFLYGAVIGMMVPYACKQNLMTPPDPIMARELRNLLREAESNLGSKVVAENWVFSPHSGLPGITPAEAIQYEGYANLVRTLLTNDALRDLEGSWSDQTPRSTNIAIVKS